MKRHLHMDGNPQALIKLINHSLQDCMENCKSGVRNGKNTLEKIK